MRRGRTAWRVVALLVAGALAASAAAQDTIEKTPGVVLGGSYTLAAGHTLRGDLVAVGASVLVESGATLEGALTAVGGNTVVDGVVLGDVQAFGGALTLGDGARVTGDLRVHYAAFVPAAGGVVEGVVEDGAEPSVLFSLPSGLRAPAETAVRVAAPRTSADGLLRTLGLGMLAALVMATLPKRVGRVRDEMARSPARAGLDGLLTLLVSAVLLALMAVTIIGIPLALLGGTLLYAAVLFGWIAVGDTVGSYLERAFHRTWSAPLRAGIGTFALSLALWILGVAPPLAGLLGLLLALVALGAVRKTRLGGRERTGRERNGRGPEKPEVPLPQG